MINDILTRLPKKTCQVLVFRQNKLQYNVTCEQVRVSSNLLELVQFQYPYSLYEIGDSTKVKSITITERTTMPLVELHF